MYRCVMFEVNIHFSVQIEVCWSRVRGSFVVRMSVCVCVA